MRCTPHTRKPRKRRSERSFANRLVGRRIRELREDRGWTQIDLEAHVDSCVKRTTISYFETGRAQPSLRTLERMAEAFGVELAVFFLNVNGDERHRLAAAVLSCPRSAIPHVAKLLDVG